MLSYLSRSAKVLIVAMALPTVSMAAGWGAILRDSPIEDFSDVELKTYLETVKSALEAAGTPQPVEWRDAESGAGATVLVVGERKLKGYDTCRRFKTVTFSKKRKGTAAHYTACKNSAGRWVLVGAG